MKTMVFDRVSTNHCKLDTSYCWGSMILRKINKYFSVEVSTMCGFKHGQYANISIHTQANMIVASLLHSIILYYKHKMLQYSKWLMAILNRWSIKIGKRGVFMFLKLSNNTSKRNPLSKTYNWLCLLEYHKVLTPEFDIFSP